MWFNSINTKSPDPVSGLWVCRKSSLALDALAVHRSGLETPLLEPLQDLVFREADI
jgi:hypothetical protein